MNEQLRAPSREFPPKARIPNVDFVPHEPEKWVALSAAAEQAYRRGFFQGIWQAIECLRAGATETQIEDYLFDKVFKWRYGSKMRCELPPVFKPKRRPKKFVRRLISKVQ